MSNPETFVGIDIAQDWLDIAWFSGQTMRIKHTPEAIHGLAERLRADTPARVVMAATGGLETPLASHLAAAGLPVAVVNPRPVRDDAKAGGPLAKTDRIDALILAACAQAIRPPARPRPAAAARALGDRLARRRQRIDIRVQEKRRRERASAVPQTSLKDHLAGRDERLERLDRDWTHLRRTSALWREKDDLLQAIPGVGRVTRATWLAWLPEMGRLNGQAMAALVGVAPFNRDSGKPRGERVIRGGRAPVRRALYRAAVSATRGNPAIRDCYQRLRQQGKPAKVALTAGMRQLLVILNARIKHHSPWNPSLEVKHSC